MGDLEDIGAVAEQARRDLNGVQTNAEGAPSREQALDPGIQKGQPGSPRFPHPLRRADAGNQARRDLNGAQTYLAQTTGVLETLPKHYVPQGAQPMWNCVPRQTLNCGPSRNKT